MASIEVSQKTKAWVQLLSLAIGTGFGLGITSYSNGCKPIAAAFIGIGAAGSAIYHAVSDPPSNPIVTTPENQSK